jgi:hypothetical protein
VFLCHQANIQFNFGAICGDDAEEKLTIGTCDGALNPNEELCCGSTTLHGTTVYYKAYNGYCVPEHECPDVQRAPPVWVPMLNNTLFAQWEANVQAPGYCCSGECSTFGCESRNLCYTVSEQGCFLNVESVDTTTPPPIKQWCEKTGIDENCVLDLNSESPITVCEEGERCEEVFRTVTLQEDGTICTQKKTVEVEKCFMAFKEGCFADLSNCTAETHTVISQGQNPQIYCDQTGNDCVEVFPSTLTFTNSYTSYHGPFCDLPPSCQEQVCFTKTNVVDEATFISLDQNANFILPEGCTTVADEGMANQEWYTKSIVCEEKSYCKLPAGTSRLTTMCIPPKTSNGNDIIVTKGNDSERIQCFDSTLQNFGDYWCPEGFKYNYLEGICIFETNVCDKGFAGNLQNGCDTPFSPSDDAFWGLYQEECFQSSNAVPSGMNVYDRACCFDAVFNNFQIWQANEGSRYVKIY